MEKHLGKIVSASFGVDGYNESQIGLFLSFEFSGYGITFQKVAWDACKIEHSEHCKWTEEDRDKEYAEITRYLSKVLDDAKVSTVDKLKGKPVEVTIDKNTLVDWRILTEVL